MAAGLQCWDAQGRMTVDLTDYSLLFVRSGTIQLPSGQTSFNLSIPGISPSTHVVMQTSVFGSVLIMTVVQNAINVRHIYGYATVGAGVGFSANYELYRFI